MMSIVSDLNARGITSCGQDGGTEISCFESVIMVLVNERPLVNLRKLEGDGGWISPERSSTKISQHKVFAII